MQLVLFGSYHQVLYVFGIEHQAGKQTSFLQLQNSLSLNDSCLWVCEGGDAAHAVGFVGSGHKEVKRAGGRSSWLKQRADLI